MRRWTRRVFVTSVMVGACLFGCERSSASDPDGGTDTSHANGGATGAGDAAAPSSFDDQDAGPLLGGVPSCGGSVQQDAPCTPGPASACIPTSGGAVCLCLAEKWKCF